MGFVSLGVWLGWRLIGRDEEERRKGKEREEAHWR